MTTAWRIARFVRREVLPWGFLIWGIWIEDVFIALVGALIILLIALEDAVAEVVTHLTRVNGRQAFRAIADYKRSQGLS